MIDNSNHVKANPLMTLPVPWVYVIAYLLGFGVQLLFPVEIRPVFWLSFTQAISIGLLVVGAILAVWAQWLFRKEHTTTDPNQTSSRLIISGPYRLSRNPMYVGLFLIFIGLSGVFTLVWSITCQIFVFCYLNWVVVPFEETQLNKSFGEKYIAYCKKAQRWI